MPLSNKTPFTLQKEAFGAAIVIEVRLAQKVNASRPMLVTLLGIVTLVRLLERNAPLPMLVTGVLLIVLGTLMAFNKLTIISGYFSFLNRFAL